MLLHHTLLLLLLYCYCFLFTLPVLNERADQAERIRSDGESPLLLLAGPGPS